MHRRVCNYVYSICHIENFRLTDWHNFSAAKNNRSYFKEFWKLSFSHILGIEYFNFILGCIDSYLK